MGKAGVKAARAAPHCLSIPTGHPPIELVPHRPWPTAPLEETLITNKGLSQSGTTWLLSFLHPPTHTPAQADSAWQHGAGAWAVWISHLPWKWEELLHLDGGRRRVLRHTEQHQVAAQLLL